MEKLTIKATKQTPKITFNPNGHLKMEGRAFPENAAAFFDPLIGYISGLNAEHIVLDIYLEYINTASSKKLLQLLQLVDDCEEIKSAVVNWHYEEGDEDSIETAEIYMESLDRIRFTFNECADIYL
ncbi:MAG: DUF1987 domain-containing protein [Bacteroidales bacterium]|nr:DUF1987 domain-containing protein [Bacteroidales bacterium]